MTRFCRCQFHTQSVLREYPSEELMDITQLASSLQELIVSICLLHSILILIALLYSSNNPVIQLGWWHCFPAEDTVTACIPASSQ